jgi:Ca2+-dependent lipid-binding protein
MEFALIKLQEIYSRMDVISQTKLIESVSQTSTRKLSHSSTNYSDHSLIKGALKITINQAENISHSSKSGFANTYVIMRVPEGTALPCLTSRWNLMYSRVIPSKTGHSNLPSRRSSMITYQSGADTILTGSSCELLRTHSAGESSSPEWNETFIVFVPPTSTLEVVLYSNGTHATKDEVLGFAALGAGVNNSNISSKLQDCREHEVEIELNPQGRLSMNITLIGEDEDLEFCFQKCRERIKRTREDYERGLCSKVIVLYKT